MLRRLTRTAATSGNVLTATDERLVSGRWRTTTTTRPHDVNVTGGGGTRT